MPLRPRGRMPQPCALAGGEGAARTQPMTGVKTQGLDCSVQQMCGLTQGCEAAVRVQAAGFSMHVYPVVGGPAWPYRRAGPI